MSFTPLIKNVVLLLYCPNCLPLLSHFRGILTVLAVRQESVLSIAPSFLLTPLLIPLYIINMADPTAIKCSKCHIYKPRLNFIKDGPLKKILKLC